MMHQIIHLCESFPQISQTGPVDKIKFYQNLVENSYCSQTKFHQNFFIVKSHFSIKSSVPCYDSRIQRLAKCFMLGHYLNHLSQCLYKFITYKFERKHIHHH